MSPSVYFASDSHFGAGSAQDQTARIERFCAWLERLDDASHLYLVGDVFDYWLDYPTYMPKVHMQVLYGLHKVIDRGVELSFVGGNHDVWAEDFFEETLGVATVESGAVVEHQGVTLRLHHGDGLLKGDRLYKAFRALVRHPVPVFVAKSIHPEILHRFADWLSRNSRARDRDTRDDILGMVREYGQSHDHGDVDHLVIGHIHTPCQLEFDGYALTCLGDWLSSNTAGRLRDGRLELLQIHQDGSFDLFDAEALAQS